MSKTKGCWLAAAMILGLAGPAAADDLFGGVTSLDASQLGGVSIGQSLLNLNTIDENATVEDTTIVAADGGEVNTGHILGNVIAHNRGITSVLANSGNNVSVNNAVIFNLYLQ